MKLTKEQLAEYKKPLFTQPYPDQIWVMQRVYDLYDTLDAYAAEVAELKAQCAAMLEKAAEHIPVVSLYKVDCRCGWYFLRGYGTEEFNREWQKHVKDTILTDHAAALAEVKRQARESERENICRWLEGDDTWPDGKIAAENLRTMAHEAAALRAEGAKQP
jgi:hypothetical protein